MKSIVLLGVFFLTALSAFASPYFGATYFPYVENENGSYRPEQLNIIKDDILTIQTVYPNGDKQVVKQEITIHGDYYTLGEIISSTSCVNRDIIRNNNPINNFEIYPMLLDNKVLIKIDLTGILDTLSESMRAKVDENNLFHFHELEVPSEQVVDRINSIPEGC